MSTSTVLARFESKSKPGHYHEVRRGADGNVYCLCPSWRFQHNSPDHRTCKHIESWKAQTTVGGVSLAVVLGPGPAAIRPVRRSRKAAPESKPVPVTVHGRHATIPCPPPEGCESSVETPAYRPTSWERL